jgi:FtsP/CotA-like multicopper oxidase with cupredoxin domain
MHLSRRSLLAGAGSLVVSSALMPRLARAAGGQTVLRLQTRQIEVGGKPVTRYGVSQASGAFGLILQEGDEINVRLENGLPAPAGLHWHGLDMPWRQDGVPYISGPPIEPGQSADYKFPAVPAGTRWGKP